LASATIETLTAVPGDTTGGISKTVTNRDFSPAFPTAHDRSLARVILVGADHLKIIHDAAPARRGFPFD
jgi:hypothetical protein